MTKFSAHRLPPWHEVAGIRSPRLLRPFGRYWIKHLTWRPYRRTALSGPVHPGRQGLRLKSRIASYDSVVNLMLDGYTALSGHRPAPATGPLVVVFNRLVGAFDDEFEDRVDAKRPLGFDEVLGSPEVHARLTDLRTFLEPHESRDAIRGYLIDSAAKQYGRYVELLTDGPADPEQQLDSRFEAAMIDSSGFLVSLARVISLFNGVGSDEAVLDQFATLGIVGKIADDVVDFWTDARSDRFNLLDGFVRLHPAEFAVTRAVLANPPRTGLRWWSRHCPQSIAALSEALAGQMDQLTEPALRRAGQVMLAPAMWGHTVLKSGPASGRL